MIRAGLTGGIASGKSVVAAMMEEMGCRILYADRMAHQLIEPGEPAHEEVLREFGRGIADAAGRVDRAKLGDIVFGDPGRLARLNEIIHPRVLREIDSELERLARTDPHGVAVVEAALLIESGYYRKLDRLIVVWCTPEQQLARLTDAEFGRGLSREQARQRIAAQMPLEEKLKLADDRIDCSGTLEQTRRQVANLVSRMKRSALAAN